MMRRRHHCRLCEGLVCDYCSIKRVTLALDRANAVPNRVCDSCYNVVYFKNEQVAKSKSYALKSSSDSVGGGARQEANLKDLLGSSASSGSSASQQSGSAKAKSSSSSSSSLGAVSATMNETGELLQERGQKLSNMADKTAKLADASSEFANMARQLKEKNKSWW